MTQKFNTLQANNYKFEIKRLPNLSFFVKSINLPGLQLGSIDVENPFVKLPTAGDKLNYNELNVEFLIEENMTNYFEIADWIKSLGYETSYTDYKDLIDSTTVLSDATLIITTNASLPNYEIIFEDIFPVSLDDIPFTNDNENPMQVSVAFRFRRWAHKKIV